MPKILIMYSNAPPSPAHLQRLRSLRPDVQVTVAGSEAVAVQAADQAAAILGHRYLRQSLPYAHQLQWIQSTAGGVHHLASPDLFRLAPLLTRCPIFSAEVAWHALALALSLCRRIPEAVLSQQRGGWQRPDDLLADPHTALVLGMGQVGRATGLLLRRLGLQVYGMDRSPDTDKAADCDLLLGPDGWRPLLPQVDLCVSALPLTRHTTRLLDAEALGSLPTHAILVVVGRSGVVDLPALLHLLRQGRLGGAAFDGFDPLPPPGDPVWSTPHLLHTPRTAVFHPQRQARLEAFFEDQVRRYLNGEDPLYRVDLSKLAEESLE